MFRRLRFSLCIICAALIMATITCWALTYRGDRVWPIGKPNAPHMGLPEFAGEGSFYFLYFLACSPGRVHLGRLDTLPLQQNYLQDFTLGFYGNNGDDWPERDDAFDAFVASESWEFMGLRYVHRAPRYQHRTVWRTNLRDGCDIVSIPFSVIILGLSVCEFFLSWRAIRSARYRHRKLNNLCLNCGYDLRAHRPGGKCPECGMPIPLPAPDPPPSPPTP